MTPDYLSPLNTFLIIAGIFCYAQFLHRFVISYELTDNYLGFLFFRHMHGSRIPISDIDEVRLFNWKDLFNYTMIVNQHGNRIIGNAVLVKRRRGFIKWMVITPDWPKEFVQRFHELKALQREPENVNPFV
jgi:hypothetical protein